MSERSQLAQRISAAVDASGLSLREIARRMKAMGVKGASAPSIHSYVHGDISPQWETLRALASVVGVHPDTFVAFGSPSAEIGDDGWARVIGDAIAELERAGAVYAAAGCQQRVAAVELTIAKLRSLSRGEVGG